MTRRGYLEYKQKDFPYRGNIEYYIKNMRNIYSKELNNSNVESFLSHLGWGNGYVILESDHPWYGIEYEDLPELNVHGGITFSGYDKNINKWVIGFDTAHDNSGNLYPDEESVLVETLCLVEQCVHGKYLDINKKTIKRLIKVNNLLEKINIY